MAEAIVSTVVEKVADLLSDEVRFLLDVKSNFEKLQDELKYIRCFLKEVESSPGEQRETVRIYVADVRDLAYDADDAIDTFLLKLAVSEERWFRRIFCIAKPISFHNTGKQIESILTKAVDISVRAQRYGIKFDGEGKASSSSAAEERRRWRRTDPHIIEEDVVGLEGSTKDLMAQLRTEEDGLRVVSIVGMGGLGKTTLAKKAYNSNEVKRHFECHSWVALSQQFSVKDLLLAILVDVGLQEDRRTMEVLTERELVERLFNFLKEKRFLVVLDDIWKEEAWDSIKPAFPNGKKGSKVLLTTRIREVAEHADPRSLPLELERLSTEDGWKLLQKKAFPGELVGVHCNEPEFEKLGVEMVERCNGLPLAIVALGGLLQDKSLDEWKIVHRNINAQFLKLQQKKQHEGVYWILGLSYLDLPFHLKPCFLYFSQFPEDFEIHKRQLIRMWIAEGFVSPPLPGEEDMTMEDVGEEYLNELVNRSMVQVNERDHTGRGVKTCSMHDLVRVMCIKKAEEENFLEVVTISSSSSPISSKSRRIVVHYYEDCKVLVGGIPCLRSLIYFDSIDKICFLGRQEGKRVFENYRLLRILKLDGMTIRSIPRAIGNLIHLRYLGLRNTSFKLRLPASIANMRSLCTLDLRDNSNVSIAHVLWKLKWLRHLLMTTIEIGRIDTLTNLETLKRVNARSLIEKDAMQKLSNLRDLSIFFRRRKEVEAVLESRIFESRRLRSLVLSLSYDGESGLVFSNLKGLSDCHVLTKLKLYGGISEDVQHNLEIFLPQSLCKLELRKSKLKKDPMPILGQLQELRFLELWSNAFIGSKMVCSADGFPQLETLRLWGLKEIEEWKVEKGAMPRLKTLKIWSLKKLKMIPEGLMHITDLQQLEIWRMPREFANRIQVIGGVEGEDFYKVCHIHNITIEDCNDETEYEITLLSD